MGPLTFVFQLSFALTLWVGTVVIEEACVNVPLYSALTYGFSSTSGADGL